MGDKELKYYTIGGENPRGKQKIFFSCHPDDFDCYFDSIKSIIMEQQSNCALWYENPEKQLADEGFLLFLEEVQLVVIPITEKLLVKPNRTMDLALPFIQKKHIPVLLLLMDERMKQFLPEKIGSLEYINPNDVDDSKVPFEQRINIFLNRVLIGEERIKIIKEAFRAYIFLSYRKKDRGYARRLMRTIHDSEGFEDVAIWFDEYLEPGENYNESIKNSIDKSDFVVLMVTPNVLEIIDGKPNYIIREEYPEAIRQNKYVLPVQMLPTNMNELEKAYPGIKKCIDGNNQLAVKVAINECVHPLKVKDKSIYHDYLIGLAYLEGIDVDRDYVRAEKLISNAAESNVKDAVITIRNMYRIGQGVEINKRKAVEWQKRLISILVEQYKDSKDDLVLDELLREELDLVGELLREDDIDGLEQAYLEMIFWGMKYLINPNLKGRILSINALNIRGKILERKECYIKAKMYYEAALKQAEHLSEYVSNLIDYQNDDEVKIYAEWMTLLSTCYENLGNIELKLQNVASSKYYYKSAMELTQTAYKADNCILNKHNTMAGHDQIYSIDIMNGVYEKALDYYESTLEERERLAQEAGSEEARHDLIVSYNRIGEIKRHQGFDKLKVAKFKEALELFRQSIEFEIKVYECGIDTWKQRLTIGELYFQIAICMYKTSEKRNCIMKMLDNSVDWLESSYAICEDDSFSSKIIRNIADAKHMKSVT